MFPAPFVSAARLVLRLLHFCRAASNIVPTCIVALGMCLRCFLHVTIDLFYSQGRHHARVFECRRVLALRAHTVGSRTVEGLSIVASGILLIPAWIEQPSKTTSQQHLHRLAIMRPLEAAGNSAVGPALPKLLHPCTMFSRACSSAAGALTACCRGPSARHKASSSGPAATADPAAINLVAVAAVGTDHRPSAAAAAAPAVTIDYLPNDLLGLIFTALNGITEL